MTPIRLRLALELGAWRRRGRRAALWWRDDDAQTATPALLRLLELADRRRTPLTLAAIPCGLSEELGRAIGERSHVLVVQHGVDHQNRNPGPAAGEFSPSWTSWEIAARLRVGWRLLEALPYSRQFYVPPWNHVHGELFAALDQCGYSGWSAYGSLDVAGGRVDAHLDLMRWRGGKRFRGAGRFEAQLLRALRERRRSGRWEVPIGLLTHHLDHDEAAWSYLERFLAWTHDEPIFRWGDLESLLLERTSARPAEQALGGPQVHAVRGSSWPAPGTRWDAA